MHTMAIKKRHNVNDIANRFKVSNTVHLPETMATFCHMSFLDCVKTNRATLQRENSIDKVKMQNSRGKIMAAVAPGRRLWHAQFIAYQTKSLFLSLNEFTIPSWIGGWGRLRRRPALSPAVDMCFANLKQLSFHRIEIVSPVVSTETCPSSQSSSKIASRCPQQFGGRSEPGWVIIKSLCTSDSCLISENITLSCKF